MDETDKNMVWINLAFSYRKVSPSSFCRICPVDKNDGNMFGLISHAAIGKFHRVLCVKFSQRMKLMETCLDLSRMQLQESFTEFFV